jgi:uncharacterized membrane protein YoaK (UPF0700 family)
MLVREGIHRNDTIDLGLASLLAAIAGSLNATAFYAAGFFSANMTGNVSSLADHIATGQFGSGLFYLAVISCFVLGAAMTATIIGAGRRRGIRGIYAYAILLEAVLLVPLGCVDIWSRGTWHVSLLILGLAFLMGLQNAVVTRISNARIRTTHVSGMITDIGIELATALEMLRGRISTEQGQENRAKLRLHLCTVCAFLAGGVIGVLSYRTFGGWLLIAISAVLLWPSITGIRRLRLTQLLEA